MLLHWSVIKMAFVPLDKMGTAGAKMFWSGKVGLAQRSAAKGVSPEHLVRFQAAFSTASKDCAAATKGMKGKERLNAKAACMSGKLGGKKA
jgi:hypothetical protein